MAVNFFFAISGYVICIVVTRPNFSCVDFLVRRAFRIYPLWIASTLIFLFLAKTVRGMSERDTPAFISYSLTLLPTQGYPFYDVGWSLQHEIAFYALAAITVPKLGLAGLVCALGLGTVLGMTADLPWYIAQFVSQYPNFLAGIIAFVAFNRFKHLNGPVLICIGLALLSACIAIGATCLSRCILYRALGFREPEDQKRLIFGAFWCRDWRCIVFNISFPPISFSVLLWKVAASAAADLDRRTS